MDDEPERAFVAAVARPGQRVDADLAELRELLTTAQCATVGERVQRCDQPVQRTYLGSGKVEELGSALEETKA
ncbi:MAG: GTPase HflX, partial [Actinomycetota bacterium]